MTEINEKEVQTPENPIAITVIPEESSNLMQIQEPVTSPEPTPEEPEPASKKPPMPKSKYKGVSYARSTNKWAAKVLLNPDSEGKRKLKHVGYYKDDLEAALARNEYIDTHNLICRKTEILDD